MRTEAMTMNLGGLAFAPLVWPRKGVGLSAVLVLEVAAMNIDAMLFPKASLELRFF